MAANHKLTSLLKGRTISGISTGYNQMIITYTNGSKMTIKAAGSPNSTSTVGTVKGVRQSGTELCLDFESGSSLTITTVEETSCVIVRSGAGVMEYAD